MWLALQYNLKVKIIFSNNKINQIKTRDWCNNVGILFKPCTSDTYAQNSGVEYFNQLIMETARAIRLFTNLPHKLWKKIIATATYLYNQIFRTSNNWISP